MSLESKLTKQPPPPILFPESLNSTFNEFREFMKGKLPHIRLWPGTDFRTPDETECFREA